MEHQENLEKFVVFKTNNHHVSMKVSLRSSFQFEDEVHDIQCVYTFYGFFSISLIKLNKINKTKQKIKKIGYLRKISYSKRFLRFTVGERCDCTFMTL